MMKRILQWIGTSLLAGVALGAVAAPQLVDKVVAVVNQDVVLQSELDALLTQVQADAREQGQSLPPPAQLRKQALDRLIGDSLVLQLADKQGLKISDTQLDQALANMAASQNISVARLQQQAASRGQSAAQFREAMRREMLLAEVRRNQMRQRINITEQEVKQVVKLLQEQGNREQRYHIGHILLNLSANADNEEQARVTRKAEQILASLRGGADFKQIAIAESSGPKALEGGDWGWMNLEEMPTLLAEAARGSKAGDIVGPLRSGAGLHIVKIFDTKGVAQVTLSEVKARHILIRPSIILSEEKAKEMLAGFVRDLKSGKASFAKLAEQYSEDPGSAVQGGDLGWANPEMYVPEFRDVVNRLKVGELSEPFRSSHGWHIVQLENRRLQDATSQATENRAYQLIYNRRFAEEVQAWMDELRDEAYVRIVDEQAAP